MDRTSFFLCRFRLGGTDAWLIWYSNGSDGILVDADGRIPCFPDACDLLRFAESRSIPVETEEPALHDLDAVDVWVSNPSRGVIDCNQLLRAWNLFTDLSASVDGSFDEDYGYTNATYEKLFQCAAASGTHEGWDADELLVLRDTLAAGLDLFRHHVHVQVIGI